MVPLSDHPRRGRAVKVDGGTLVVTVRLQAFAKVWSTLHSPAVPACSAPTTSGESRVVSVLSSFVWSVADTLRGPYSEAEYGRVVLPFTVLRRLESVMEPHRSLMAEVVGQYGGEQQRRTYLKIRTRTEDNAGLSFWTTRDYTLKKALQDPDKLAENLIDYVGGFSANFGQYPYQSRRLRTVGGVNAGEADASDGIA